MRAIRAAVGAVCCLALLVGEAASAQLSVQEIVRHIPGRWELDPSSVEPGAPNRYRCDDNYLTIWTEEQDGTLHYRSLFAVNDTVSRAPIRTMQGTSGDLIRAILLQYEDEDRVTEDGRLVEWFLIMPNMDEFYWIRRDWGGEGGRTASRLRCKDPAIS